MPHHIPKRGIHLFRLGFQFVRGQRANHFSLGRCRDQFVGIFHIHGNGSGTRLPQLQEVHEPLENVHFEHHRFALGSSDFCVGRGEFFDRLNVLVEFKIEAALQLAALTCELAWVQRQLLVPRGACAHGAKVLEPRTATELSAAHANATNSRGLLPGSNLAHVHADVEGARQLANEVPKIHPLLRGVVKRRPCVVALKFHVGQLHADAQPLDDLSRLAKGVVLPLSGSVPQRDVLGIRFSNDALELVVVFDFPEFELALDQFSRQAHHTHVHTRVEVDDHHISHVNRQVSRPSDVSFSVVLEPQLNHVVR